MILYPVIVMCIRCSVSIVEIRQLYYCIIVYYHGGKLRIFEEEIKKRL